MTALARSATGVAVVGSGWLDHVQTVALVGGVGCQDLGGTEGSDGVVEGVGVEVQREAVSQSAS